MNLPVGLSALQWDLLWTLSKRGSSKGIAVRQGIVDYYGEEVPYSEVYPNLDALVDLGLVVKRTNGGHTNEYELTEKGRCTLARRQIWQDGLSESNNGP